MNLEFVGRLGFLLDGTGALGARSLDWATETRLFWVDALWYVDIGWCLACWKLFVILKDICIIIHLYSTFRRILVAVRIVRGSCCCLLAWQGLERAGIFPRCQDFALPHICRRLIDMRHVCIINVLIILKFWSCWILKLLSPTLPLVAPSFCRYLILEVKVWLVRGISNHKRVLSSMTWSRLPALVQFTHRESLVLILLLQHSDVLGVGATVPNVNSTLQELRWNILKAV